LKYAGLERIILKENYSATYNRLKHVESPESPLDNNPN